MSDVTFDAINKEQDKLNENNEDGDVNDKLEKALATIKSMEQSIGDKSEMIQQLEKSIETKDDISTMRQAAINSLEMESLNKDVLIADTQISKFKRVVMNTADTMEKMKIEKSGGGSKAWRGDAKFKLKKSNDDVKSLKKSLEEASVKFKD